MNRTPYPFRDFVRAKEALAQALGEIDEVYGIRPSW